MDIDLKRIIGALIFASGRSVKISEIKRCIRDVSSSVNDKMEEAEDNEPECQEKMEMEEEKISDKEIRDAITGLQSEFEAMDTGFRLVEVAGGFRFETDVRCGKWLKRLLKQGGTQKLSQPALETLAIIAYRQPISRSEMERIRGVSVDHIVRNLMEIQFIKIVGRSELPGKAFLYGTTLKFLQYFGLKNLKELEEMQPMLKAEMLAAQRARPPVTGHVNESSEDEESANPAEEDAGVSKEKPENENGSEQQTC